MNFEALARTGMSHAGPADGPQLWRLHTAPPLEPVLPAPPPPPAAAPAAVDPLAVPPAADPLAALNAVDIPAPAYDAANQAISGDMPVPRGSPASGQPGEPASGLHDGSGSGS